MPTLFVDGVSGGQTSGIASFCGKLSGLYLIDDHIIGARIDQIIRLTADVDIMISQTVN